MLLRTVSAVIGIGLFLGLCFAGLLPFTCAVILIAALGAHEFVSAQRRAPTEGTLAPRAASPFAWLNPLLAWLGVGLPALAYLLCRERAALTASYALAVALVIAVCAGIVAR